MSDTERWDDHTWWFCTECQVLYREDVHLFFGRECCRTQLVAVRLVPVGDWDADRAEARAQDDANLQHARGEG